VSCSPGASGVTGGADGTDDDAFDAFNEACFLVGDRERGRSIESDEPRGTSLGLLLFVVLLSSSLLVVVGGGVVGEIE
jgi:hypothetical protein